MAYKITLFLISLFNVNFAKINGLWRAPMLFLEYIFQAIKMLLNLTDPK